MKTMIILPHQVHGDGKQLFPHGRTAQIGTAFVGAKVTTGSNKLLPAIGCHSEGKCIFTATYETDDPAQLWRAMYAASRMFHVSVRAMEVAILLVGKAPIDESLAREARVQHLSCDYTAESLRKEALEQEIPPDDLKKIATGLGLKLKAPVFRHKKEVSTILKNQIVFLKHLSESRNNAPGNRIAV
jgi:hypothetical protein